MASEMVKAATSDKLKEMDWAKNIQICELVARNPGKAKDIIKAIKKCVGSKSKNTQLYAVMLLEMLLNDCGEPIHRQVIDNGLLPILVKIVKKKMQPKHHFGGAKAKFPQYYEAYYDLVSAGVQFSNHPNIFVTRAEVPVPETRTEPNREILSTKSIGGQQEMATQPAADRLAADTRLRKRKALSQDYADKRLWAPNIRSPDSELRPDPAPMIPPSPSKHAERERFFREKSLDCWPIPGVVDPTGGILAAPQKLAQDVKDSPPPFKLVQPSPHNQCGTIPNMDGVTNLPGHMRGPVTA